MRVPARATGWRCLRPARRAFVFPGDLPLLRLAAARPGTGHADAVLRLVPLADDLKLWLAISPLLAVSGRRGRRALFEAWVAVAASAGLGKAGEALARRARPGQCALGERIVAGDEPATTALPSSHTSSAVAFALAAGRRWRPAGMISTPVAAFVMWTRVAGGRHYPSDVLAGAVNGAPAATLAGWLLRRADLLR